MKRLVALLLYCLWPICWYGSFLLPIFISELNGIECFLGLAILGSICGLTGARLERHVIEEERLAEVEAARQYEPENVYGKSEFVDDEQLRGKYL